MENSVRLIAVFQCVQLRHEGRNNHHHALRGQSEHPSPRHATPSLAAAPQPRMIPAMAKGLAWTATLAISACSLLAKDAVDFNRDIRPILSDKCFQCHGPDEETLEADLRLDQRDSAVELKAIVPGKSSESLLVERINSHDPDETMPPPKIKKPVTAEEAALLAKWIDQGAEYEKHWSFEPLESDGEKNSIDEFVVAALEKNGLTLSPEAQPETLARRLFLDLTGLLPPPNRVESFLRAHAESPDGAVAALVDELLDSPHYGERWGRHWLDQARYADSHGYTIDGERVMWPYRDWVIRAVNDDMPFDQFTIEQIAGDLLPDPEKAQLVATGFHRNTLINQEGGTDDEQFRNEEVVDRVNTTGAVWLGLTLGCAQCHTHKFDPISHREYFEMFAFFNSGTDVNNTGTTVGVGEGEMFLENPDPKKLAALNTAKAEFSKTSAEQGKRQAEWEKAMLGPAEEHGSVNWTRVTPAKLTAEGGAPLELLDDHSILAGVGAPNETYRMVLSPSTGPVAALRLQLLTHESLPKKGPGLAGNGNIVLTRVEFSQNGKPVVVKHAEHDHAQPGFSAANTIDGNAETGWAINVGKGTAAGVKMNAEHEIRFTLAEPIAPGSTIEVVLRHEKNANYNIGRFAWDTSPTPPPSVAAEKLLTALKKPADKRSAEDKKYLSAEFAKVDTGQRKAQSQVDKARKALGIGKPVPTMVMRDLPEPRETFIHERGDFLRHDKETGPLHPGVPAVLPSLPDTEEKRTRLDLAKWLVRPDQPLTPRVTVNRVWMRYFGKGLVETENDFGTQGAFPTHPELLDWLALTFVKNGWSMKELHRLIAISKTYRQSSNAAPAAAKTDPLNHLIARQNRIRVEAEIVRDAALSASGLLHPEIGGPGVMPPQPEGVYAFTQRKVNWVAANGPDRFRRALYTKFFRSAPYPLLTTFDSPDFQSVCTGRVRSNTPLQSLTLANDAAMIELAKGLGARVMREAGGSDTDRIRHAFSLCYSRLPSDSELTAVGAFQQSQEEAFAKDESAAESVAPDEYPETYASAEAASWSAVARALLNTDEFITRE